MIQSVMAKEASETPEVIARQLSENALMCQKIADSLRQSPPRMIMIIGRGSSDHAGVFAKYLFEVELGIPVCAAAPSVSGVFNRDLKLDDCLAIVISQSGRSPDILNQVRAAKRGGARTLAIVNDQSSPLAHSVDDVLPIRAGKEQAVAATKSYLATLSCLLHLCSLWSGNESMIEGLKTLPDALKVAIASPAQLVRDKLENVKNAVVLGRGFGYAVGREVALKLKEVLSIHAEAFSSAEFVHGPVTLAEKALNVINLRVNDETVIYHDDILADVTKRGATVQKIESDTQIHARLLPLLILQRFYLDIEAIAVEMGLNPDQPPGLNKVTKTV